MLFSKGKNNIALIANSVGLVATVVFDVLLIPKYGIIGAAAATSISYFLLFTVLLYYLVRKEELTFSEIFIVRKDDFVQLFQKD
jgi:O-antigen/teichoic acid export membrane protein